ncbi:sporulation protein [Rossellomorea vietnamensis]|uniref:Sporulation protein n=1 Tax=Rossellomorea vietnamensis TaxID=218284 RepID=A0A5D4NWS0_9BACI|nr:CAP domain-containing protein [Rossellomorea vietnamensis]TYS18803.1 sporulation protein [Rossellomorea vietnamensis]
MNTKKKMIVSTATALTLMAAPFLNNAEAASGNTTTQTQQKVYTHQFSGNHDELNKWIQEIMSKYNVKWPTQQQTSKPAEEQPVNDKQTEPAETPAAKEVAPESSVPAAPQQPTEQPKQTTEAASGTLSQFERQVVDLTNQERAKAGLPALTADAELSNVAREKSNDMQTKNYFSHTSPTYGSPFDMMNSFGIDYRAAGENIAMGQRTPEEVVKAWMNSDGHRKNILSSNFTHIGVGHDANGNYWTQMFIGK